MKQNGRSRNRFMWGCARNWCAIDVQGNASECQQEWHYQRVKVEHLGTHRKGFWIPVLQLYKKKSYAFFMCMWIVYACVSTLCAVVWAQWHVWRPVEDAAWTPLELLTLLLEAGALTVPGVYHFSPSLVAGKSQWASCCDVTFPALGLPAHVWPSVTFHIGTGDPNSGPKHTVTH